MKMETIQSKETMSEGCWIKDDKYQVRERVLVG